MRRGPKPSFWYTVAEIKTSTDGALLSAPLPKRRWSDAGNGHQDVRPRDGVHVPGQLARTAAGGHGVGHDGTLPMNHAVSP
jgi:hypothetical protein